MDSASPSPLMCPLPGTPSASLTPPVGICLAALAGMGRPPHLPRMPTRGPSGLLGQLDGSPSFAESCKLLHGQAFSHQCRDRRSNQPLSQMGKPRPGKGMQTKTWE